MYVPQVVIDPKKLFTTAIISFMALLLAVYGPMASITSAQSSIDAAFNTLKQDVLDEINRRVAAYEKTIASLNITVNIDKNAATGTISSDNGSASASVGNTGAKVIIDGKNGGKLDAALDAGGLNVSVQLPSDLKEKAKANLQAVVDELKKLGGDVANLTSAIGSTAYQKLQSIAQNLISQFNLDVLSQAQAAVTQAVDSISGVLNGLKSAATNLQSQLTALKKCADDVSAGKTSITGTASVADGVTVSCGDYNVNSKDVVATVQSQLENVKTVISTISSILLSLVTMVISVASQFSSLAGGLGGLSSLSGLLSGGGLSSLTNLDSSVGGLTGSLGGVVTQLGTLSGMAGSAMSLLTSLSSLINV